VVGHNSATGRNEIYINGVLDNFLGGIVLTQSVGGSLRLQNSLLLPGPAGGYMKEVVFANVAPTTAIASGLYNGGAGQLASAVIPSANIKAYYRMRDAVGSVSMIDSSVNGLTGLIFNYAAPTYGYVTSP
jgi:hypothetical protein